MSGSDVEKGAGVQSPQQPRATLSRPHDDFLPTYQEHLNTELRNFPEADSQARLQPFDHIQEPTTKSKATLRRRFWWSAVSISLFLTISALIGSAVFLYRSTHLKNNTVKHAPQTSMPMPARSVTTVTVYPTTVVVTLPAKHTVFVTVPAAPVPGTTTRIVTVHVPPTSTTSQDLVSSTTASTTTAEEASLITFSTLSSSSSTTPSSSTRTSSSSEASTTTPPPPPPPSTVPTTLVSITTATLTPSTSSTSIPRTITGRPLGFCGVPGEFCA